MINSLANSQEKGLNNIYPKVFRKELKNKGIDNVLVDTGLNIVGKKIKKGIWWITSSGITLTNYEAKILQK